jgi:hypothetical protein
VDGQAGLDPCWSPMHYVGFVMARLISPKSGKRSEENITNNKPANKLNF